MFNLDKVKKNLELVREKLLKNYKHSPSFEDDKIDFFLKKSLSDVELAMISVQTLHYTQDSQKYQLLTLQNKIDNLENQVKQYQKQEALSQKILGVLNYLKYSQRFMSSQENQKITNLIEELKACSNSPEVSTEPASSINYSWSR